MQILQYYWINVFTTQQDQGNPLPVVILNQALSTHAMQQIATMFNQSETIFIEAAQSDLPKLHIYTPMHELPFAGHPIIGALEVLNIIREQKPLTSVLCKSGIVHASYDAENKIYWIKAPTIPSQRKSALDISLTAKMLGITKAQILHEPIWINSGSEQLLVQINDPQAIDAITVDLGLFEQYATLYPGRSMIYLWAKSPDGIYARYLYLNHGALREDSGTGSAAANLGGWHLLQGQTNLEYKIQQGTYLGQESILYLKVTSHQEIWIGGQNRLLGKGELHWQDGV